MCQAPDKELKMHDFTEFSNKSMERTLEMHSFHKELWLGENNGCLRSHSEWVSWDLSPAEFDIIWWKQGRDDDSDFPEKETEAEKGMEVCVRLLWRLLTVYHKLGDLQQQKFVFSQVWRPEVWNQHHWVTIGLSAGHHLQAVGESLSLASSSLSGLQASLGSWLHLSSLCPCLHITFSSVFLKSPFDFCL